MVFCLMQLLSPVEYEALCTGQFTVGLRDLKFGQIDWIPIKGTFFARISHK